MLVASRRVNSRRTRGGQEVVWRMSEMCPKREKAGTAMSRIIQKQKMEATKC